ncbi:portal protein [Paenibacillus oleatilyticus]|uniref:Portal protein n=1 Tax=Paenibacillus oleatilyticus TaxID=2594886 RepID=A0ABV4VCF3_9BACL
MAAILEKAKEKVKTAVKNTTDKLEGIFTSSDGVDPNAKVINTDDQQKLYDNIMQDYNVFKAARQSVEPLWREEMRFYDGDHWYGLRSPSASRLRPNSVDNIAWAQVESIVGKLSGWDPWPDFQAQEQRDEPKASDLNAYMPYELAQIKFKQKYIHAIRQCIVHGPLVFKTVFDPNVEGGRGMNRFIGRNDIIPVDLGSFFPDPRITDFIYLQEMGAIIINTRKTMEYFQERWPEQGPKVQPDNMAQDVQIFTYPNYGMAQNVFNFTDTTWYPWDASTQTKTAGLIEYWYRGLPKMMTNEDKQLFREMAEEKLMQSKDPSECLAKARGTMEGVHCVYVSTSGVFLEHKSYVYDHGQYPFTARTLFPNGRNVWGKGFMRDMIKPQIMLNKFAEIAVETSAKSGNSAIVYEEGVITKPQTWKEQRSQESAMLPVAQGRMNDWKELQGVNVPETVFKMLNYYQEMLQKIPGQFDSSNGQPNSNVTSGEQAKALIAAASTRLNPVSDLISDALSDVFGQYIELIAQFYTDQRIARVTGRQVSMGRDSLISHVPTTFQKTTDDGQTTEIPVMEEYVPEFDIIVKITAEKPSDMQYWLNLAFNLLPLADPITGLPLIDAEAVQYVIQNGRMESMDIIEKRIQEKSGIMQQFQQVQQQNQQLQAENAGMQQQLSELVSMKQQQEAEDRHFNRGMQSRKMDLEEAKMTNQIMKDQAPILMGGAPSG